MKKTTIAQIVGGVAAGIALLVAAAVPFHRQYFPKLEGYSIQVDDARTDSLAKRARINHMTPERILSATHELLPSTDIRLKYSNRTTIEFSDATFPDQPQSVKDGNIDRFEIDRNPSHLDTLLGLEKDFVSGDEKEFLDEEEKPDYEKLQDLIDRKFNEFSTIFTKGCKVKDAHLYFQNNTQKYLNSLNSKYEIITDDPEKRKLHLKLKEECKERDSYIQFSVNLYHGDYTFMLTKWKDGAVDFRAIQLIGGRDPEIKSEDLIYRGLEISANPGSKYYSNIARILEDIADSNQKRDH